MIAALIISFVFIFIGLILAGVFYENEEIGFTICFLSVLVFCGLCVFGMFHGFINYPKTEGTHQGELVAVDLEGVYFRRYEVYLKSGGINTSSSNSNVSDETKYCLYDYETDLKEKLDNAIGKKVKLYYSHDGGYIGWKSCGTYHIKDIEIIEEVEEK